MSQSDRPPGDEWRDHAACADMDNAIFYPDADFGPGRKAMTVYPAEARDTCNACPVRQDCLDHAMAAAEPYGMWGGTTPTERRKMRGTTSTCNGCGNPFHRTHGGLRYCPACRPTLGDFSASKDVERSGTMSEAIPEGV